MTCNRCNLQILQSCISPIIQQKKKHVQFFINKQTKVKKKKKFGWQAKILFPTLKRGNPSLFSLASTMLHDNIADIKCILRQQKFKHAKMWLPSWCRVPNFRRSQWNSPPWWLTLIYKILFLSTTLFLNILHSCRRGEEWARAKKRRNRIWKTFNLLNHSPHFFQLSKS